MTLPTPFRIAGPVSAISLLLLIAGVAGAWYVHVLQNRTSDMLEHNVASIRAAEELELLIRELRTEINQFFLTEDQAHLATGLAMKEGIDRWSGEARRRAMSEAEKSLARTIDRDIAVFFREFEKYDAHSTDAQSQASLRQTTHDVLTDRILVNARKYLDINEQDLERSQADSRAMTSRVVLALLLLGTCGSIAGLLAGYGIARGISRELVHLSIPIRDVAGKLNEVVGPITVSATPGLRDLQSELVLVSNEVSEIVAQLQQSHREMMRADQLAATGQLAAGLAHELRNPLMSIKLIIQAARRSVAGTERLDENDLRVLDEEVTRLESLLQTFLEFAKPATPQTTRVDLKKVVAPSVQLLTRRAALKNATITTRLDDRLCEVDGDESHLRQVLLNLLLNALDAITPDGEVTVEVKRVADQDVIPPHIELCVADNGHGLSEEAEDRIFEPFFSTRETGLGLGLPICQRIVDSHGGTITAGNRPGGGAEFVVMLPLASANAPCENGGPQSPHLRLPRIVQNADVAPD